MPQSAMENKWYRTIRDKWWNKPKIRKPKKPVPRVECPNCKKATELIVKRLKELRCSGPVAWHRAEFERHNLHSIMAVLLTTDKEELIKRGVIPW